MITLLEGNTPLLEAPRIAERAGVARVLLKVEGLNPTGSFKDRGMTMAISTAVERGAKVAICASTGNTSASAAAYAARAGLVCAVVIPEGQIALGKLAQALIHGARVVPIRGNFDHALEVVRELGEHPGCRGRELGEPRADRRPEDRRVRDHRRARGRAARALHPGRQRRQHHGLLAGLLRVPQARRATRACPACWGGRPPGAAPIVIGEPVLHPETIATAIQIGNPASWDGAVDARDESGGHIGAVTDGDIIEAYRMLAAEEGCFVEPASAASVAGLLRASADGLVAPDETVVCTVTGHGLKDPQRAISEVQVGASVAPTSAAVAAALDLHQ